MSIEWPFGDPPNLAVFTTVQVMRQGLPILTVSRNPDDDTWSFLHLTERETPRVADAMIVGLQEIFEEDPTIGEIADLQPGWIASRPSIGAPWQRVEDPEAFEE